MVVEKLTEAKKAQYLKQFKQKVSDAEYNARKATFDTYPSQDQSDARDGMSPVCDEFFETKEYESGDKEYGGYRYCCDMYGLCGMSGWWIFFIIVIVIGCLAAAGAAFWFFYLKRKMGGRDEQEKDTDSEESSTKKSDYDISIDTY